MADTTNITVRDDQWEELDSRKGRGDSFADVIDDLLEQADEGDDE